MPQLQSSFLKVRNLDKFFGRFQALKDVSLDVHAGEFVCFLGPSGCGKTTLLRAIAGLDMQDKGTIEQGGRDISRLPPVQRDFGIVFQSYALFPNLTVAQNIGYGLASVGRDKNVIAARVSELIELVGLGGQEPKYPSQLSGGQQQRVALARAIAMSPGLLLLDEPLSALDARVRIHLRDELKALQRRLGVTTIMVTHDQEEALAIADRIVVMNHGVIEQVGAPQDIYRHPATPFVADFVGHMNFLPGRLRGAGQIQIGPVELKADVSDIRVSSDGTVMVCFRPEDVQIRGLNLSQPNVLTLGISKIEFLGSFCRAALTFDGNAELSLTADFSMNAMRDLALNLGKSVTIALPPDRLRVFNGPVNGHG
jgi:iron(III) transport system ATP-binding protein